MGIYKPAYVLEIENKDSATRNLYDNADGGIINDYIRLNQ